MFQVSEYAMSRMKKKSKVINNYFKRVKWDRGWKQLMEGLVHRLKRKSPSIQKVIRFKPCKGTPRRMCVVLVYTLGSMELQNFHYIKTLCEGCLKLRLQMEISCRGEDKQSEKKPCTENYSKYMVMITVKIKVNVILESERISATIINLAHSVSRNRVSQA